MSKLSCFLLPCHYSQQVIRSPSLVFASTADRKLHVLDAKQQSIVASHVSPDGSPILSILPLDSTHILLGSMSGALTLFDIKAGEQIAKRNDHNKFLVHISQYRDTATGCIYVATAGWDQRVHVYKLHFSSDQDMSLSAPASTTLLASNPLSLTFVMKEADNSSSGGALNLVVTRRDSTMLHYYDVKGMKLSGTQNLAPQSIAWVAFELSSIAICPTDPTLLAVATSSVPHMKLIIVRMLFPQHEGTHALQRSDETLAEQERSKLARQDREIAAISISCSTFAPQTLYSTPAIAWRPDGSGIWVNGDDGIVRGIERHTGKVISTLDGHDANMKVRCLCSISSATQGDVHEDETMVSGGFDGKIVIWKPT